MDSKTKLDPAKLLGFKLQAGQTASLVVRGAKIGKPQPAPMQISKK